VFAETETSPYGTESPAHDEGGQADLLSRPRPWTPELSDYPTSRVPTILHGDDPAASTAMLQQTEQRRRPEVDRAQVRRQVARCAREARELRRLVVSGGREWWAGPGNQARRRDLRQRWAALRHDALELYRGDRAVSDVAFQATVDAVFGLDALVQPLLDQGPLGATFEAAGAAAQVAHRAMDTLREFVSGEFGSAAQPVRHGLVTTFDHDAADAVLVDARGDGTEEDLNGGDEWMIVG